MRKLILFGPLLLIAGNSFACINCNNEVKNAIFNDRFYPNLFIMLSAFIVLAIIVAILTTVTTRSHRAKLALNTNTQMLNPVPLTTAATVLGIGIGGFIDGIALHQILQWHEMVSNVLPPTTYVAKSANMFWDGIFHAFTLLVVIVGIVLMWKLLFKKDVDRSGKLLAGGLILGWGIFNIVEGIIDHQVLKLHNVREVTNNKEAWNYGFLGLSIIFLLLGWLLVSGRKRATG